MEWSTVVDAPTTYLLTEDMYKEYFKDRYWQEWIDGLDLDYIKKHWSYWIPQHYKNVREIVKWNRAWKNEKRLSYKQLIEEYIYR